MVEELVEVELLVDELVEVVEELVLVVVVVLDEVDVVVYTCPIQELVVESY